MEEKNLLSLIMPTREEFENSCSPEDDLIYLLNSVDEEGKQVYLYLSVKAKNLYDFADAVNAEKPLNVLQYGEILMIGEGESPSEEVLLEMREKYGVITPEEMFEKIAPEIDRRVKNHIDKKAEDSIMSKIEEMKKLQSGSDDKK